jgi:hypothetical protein
MRTLVLLSIVVAFAIGAVDARAQAPVPVRPQAPGSPTGGAPGPRPPGFPARDPSQTPTGTAVLRGRVTRADSGAPIRRAQVTVFAPELRESRTAMTDDEGRYELKQLPGGRYTVGVNKGGYVALQFGQRRPFEPGQPLQLVDGQILEKIDFALPRGGVITGRIVDEFGEPVTGAQVQAMRYRFVNGGRRLMPVQSAPQTDDRGEFRIFGVAPGDYYVNATVRQMTFGGVSDDRVGYAPTYYPGTPVSSEAQRVTVGIGEEVDGISFSIAPTRTANVTGIARDGEGKPMSNSFVNVIQRTDNGLPQYGAGGAQTRADGSFTISNLPPGSYTLQARSNGASNGDVATQDVTVNGSDLTGLLLSVVRGATARGRIRFDGGAPTNLNPAETRIFPGNVDGAIILNGGGPITVKDDWTFEGTGLSGRRLLRVASAQGWAVKSITVDGEDVTDTGIEFNGEDVEGIDIVLTQKLTEVAGAVTDGRGSNVADAVVVVFADDREKWTPTTRFIMTARPDQEGRYKVRGLPPGRYLAAAIDYLEPGEERDPELLDRLRPRATRVTLGEGEMKQLDMKVSAGS